MMIRSIGIACNPGHGGSGVVPSELAKCLAEEFGFKVHVISPDYPFRLKGYEHPNLTVHVADGGFHPLFQQNPANEFAMASEIVKVAIENNVQVLNSHYAGPLTMAAIQAKRVLGDHLKVIATLHGTDMTSLPKDKYRRMVMCSDLRECDAITAVSESLQRDALKLLDGEVEVERIYNAVDTNYFFPRTNPELRKRFCSWEEKLLIHVSNFRPVKRTEDVVKVFYLVQQQVPARLLLVGDGPDQTKIKDLIQELNMVDKVTFIGKVSEPSEFFSVADLNLLPSKTEGFPLVVLEAAACGTPTIGTKVGGLPEAVLNGQTGYLAELGDIDAMANFAIKLLKDSALYNKLANNGLARTRNYFTPRGVANQYVALYVKVLEAGHTMH